MMESLSSSFSFYDDDDKGILPFETFTDSLKENKIELS